MYAIQHRCISLKVDVSQTKLIYVFFEFVLLRITIIYLTKHGCIHVRNFVRKKPPYDCAKFWVAAHWNYQKVVTAVKRGGWNRSYFQVLSF